MFLGKRSLLPARERKKQNPNTFSNPNFRENPNENQKKWVSELCTFLNTPYFSKYRFIRMVIYSTTTRFLHCQLFYTLAKPSLVPLTDLFNSDSLSISDPTCFYSVNSYSSLVISVFHHKSSLMNHISWNYVTGNVWFLFYIVLLRK